MLFPLILKALVFAVAACSITATPSSIVSGSGLSKGTKQIAETLASNRISSVNNLLKIVDCSGERVCTINALVPTTFDAQPGVFLDGTKDCLVLYALFDSMSEGRFCGSKAVDYIMSLPGLSCIAMKDCDLNGDMLGYDQMFRRIISLTTTDSKDSSPLIFAVMGDSAFDVRLAETAIRERLLSIWKDLNRPVASFSSAISIHVIHFDPDVDRSIADARSALISLLRQHRFPSEDYQIAARRLHDAWLSAEASRHPRALFSSAEKESILAVEMAYTSCVANVDNAIAQWQRRVGQGKTIGRFADRVKLLLAQIRQEFLLSTAGSLAVQERNDRLKKLSAYVTSSTATLLQQQLVIIESAVTDRFRGELVRLLRAETDTAGDESGSKRDGQMNALRKSIFDFKAATSDFEDPTLGFSTAAAAENLSASLEAVLQEFPETGVARLEEIRKVELRSKAAKGGKKKGKSKRAIAIALSLVGMLRPPGRGTLQGFAGYSTSLLGLPFDMLLGVQNDGDSPEIMGEDREYPILRLQPKISFDLDL